MPRVNIIKGSIRNVVEEEQFEKLYKPNGWLLDLSEDIAKDKEPQIPLDLLNTESEVKNYIKMKKKQPKRFDDGLFYSDLEIGEENR